VERSTRIIFVRHAQTSSNGRALAGRSMHVSLSAHGRAQAVRLADRLSTVTVAAIYASPLTRAVESAQPLSARVGLPVQRLDDLSEVDFGDWTGARFDHLAGRREWDLFNSRRSAAVIPGGETWPEVVQRVTRALDALCRRHPGDTIVAVTHGDIIRVAVLCVLGLDHDAIHRLTVSVASITVLEVGADGRRVLCLNATDEDPSAPTG
jgi:broad specificity phosphatase PhoE